MRPQVPPFGTFGAATDWSGIACWEECLPHPPGRKPCSPPCLALPLRGCSTRLPEFSSRGGRGEGGTELECGGRSTASPEGRAPVLPSPARRWYESLHLAPGRTLERLGHGERDDELRELRAEAGLDGREERDRRREPLQRVELPGDPQPQEHRLRGLGAGRATSFCRTSSSISACVSTCFAREHSLAQGLAPPPWRGRDLDDTEFRVDVEKVNSCVGHRFEAQEVASILLPGGPPCVSTFALPNKQQTQPGAGRGSPHPPGGAGGGGGMGQAEQLQQQVETLSESSGWYESSHLAPGRSPLPVADPDT